MKKGKFIAVFMIVLSLMGLVGCNYKIIDTKWSYDTAIIKLANDEIVEVNVQSWTDYEGEQIQVIADDGTVYLTSSYRCDLISSPDSD